MINFHALSWEDCEDYVICLMSEILMMCA